MASLTLVFLVSAGLLQCCQAKAQPNFVVLLSDDHNQDGYAIMPNLVHGIMNRGITLTNAFAASPICCPSRGALFSSLYPHNLGDPTLGWCGNFSKMREKDNFLNALSLHNYTVGQFGKWYNEEQTFLPPYQPEWLARNPRNEFLVMTQEGIYFNNSYNHNGAALRPGGYLTSFLGNASVDFIQRAAAHVEQNPFVAFVAFHAPHLPADPAPWYADADISPYPSHAPRLPNYNVGWQDKHWFISQTRDKPMSPALIAASDALFVRRMRTLLSVDDAIGGVLGALEAYGVANNTYVIYTSDHGYHLGAWGLWSEKANPYQSDALVPFAMRGPGIAPASTSPALVSLLDMAPTLLELAGAPGGWPEGGAGPQRDGTSLTPLLFPHAATNAATGATWRERLLVEFVGWQNYEWLQPCSFHLPFPDSTCNTGRNASNPSGLINAQSNNFVALRVQNATHNCLFAEYRPPMAALSPAQTNFTEFYNLSADPWQITNAVASLSELERSAWRDELWQYAACRGSACP